MEKRVKKSFAITLIIISFSFLLIDTIYKLIKGISYLNRQECILYRIMPEKAFLFFEYFIELTLLVIAGIFIAVLLEKYFSKQKRFYPKNPITAFLYGSILPLCACAVIPILGTLKKKIKMSTLITFVIAAPLLSPYIIMLSLTVMGLQYTIIRIIASFILAITTGLVVQFFYNNEKLKNSQTCNKTCFVKESDIFLESFRIIKIVFPYIILAGIMSLAIELSNIQGFLLNLNNGLISRIISIFIGIPIYLCHGVDVLLLRPLTNRAGLSIGSAITFSLSSTAVCISSFILMMRFIGKKLTSILFITIIILTLIIGLLTDYILSLI